MSERVAQDGFERYYSEKLWAWLPEIHRLEDGSGERPGVLRALVEVIAGQIAVARRSVDRLAEDAFIETSDDWAVAYLADLVGTRLVSELNRRARRVDVARTIFYRRRKGTPRVLEMLVRDIAGVDGALVESFRRLARTRHRLDPVATPGRVTGTPPGGFARLDSPRLPELLDGPFDELAHTPDLRQHRGRRGRWNLPRLNFHLYRLAVYRVEGATPFALGNDRFTFDPSGRDVPLFAPGDRSNEDCEPALEWEVPAPIPCRLLGEAAFQYDLALLDGLGLPPSIVAGLAGLAGDRFVHEARLRETLSHLDFGALPIEEAHIDALLAAAVTDDSARPHLVPRALEVDDIPGHHVVAGNLADFVLPAVPASKEVMIDPVRGRFAFFAPHPGTPSTLHHVGFPGPTGAGTFDRSADLVDGAPVLPPGPAPLVIPPDGAHELDVSTTRTLAAEVTAVRQLLVQAADGVRPYLVADGSPWGFEAAAKDPVPPGEEDPPANLRLLTLDGLWLGARRAPAAFVLAGVWDRVVLRHVTVDPGGAGVAAPVLAVPIVIAGVVEELIVDASILGALRVEPGGELHRLVVRDSIIGDLAAPLGDVDLARVTVFGDVRCDRLHATETLVTGHVHVTDNQHGCFRFSAASGGSSRFPPRFAAHVFAEGVPDHVFTSTRFGDPGYAQLSGSAPVTLARGGENGGEIGAWNRLLLPIRLADLDLKIDEYMPFGLIPQLIVET